MDKETSSHVSSIAAHVLHLPVIVEGVTVLAYDYNELLARAKTLAGSCMAQDETPGQAPTTFLARLKNERDDLAERLHKLSTFMTNGAPGSSPRHNEMLGRQLICMAEYLEVLDERLADLAPASVAEIIPIHSDEG